MAEQSVDLPVASEKAKSSEIQLRRHSTGKASFENNKEKVIPRYLRASTGSCHDICKYGRKYAFEANEKHPISRRASLYSKTTKMLVVEPRKSIDPMLQISCTSDTNKLHLPTKLYDSKKQLGNEVLVNRNKASLVTVKPSLFQKSHVSSIPKISHEISSTFKGETKLKSTSKKETPSKSTSKKKETALESTCRMAKTHSKSTSKMETSPKFYFSKGKEMELSEKPVVSLNPNSIVMQTISSMDSSDGFGGQSNSEIKMEKREASCKVVSPSRASLSSKSSLKRNERKHKSLKIVSCLKNQPKTRRVEPKKHDSEVEEKTLYVIKMGNENQTLQSDQNGTRDNESSPSHTLSSPKFSSSSIIHSPSQEDQEESEYSTSEFEEDSSSGNCETEYIDNGECLEVEENGNPQKDYQMLMLKLKLVRGKLVEAQIQKNSPRRLIFRRGKVLEDNATNVKVGDDNSGDTSGPEKVKLRHLNVHGKKDGQRLLNNVIEETASKLVKSQKSKVKALVGAFETVISLQEEKTFANIVS